MKTVIMSAFALTAAASIPAFADPDKGAEFSYNPNKSVAEIYVDLDETANTICAADYKNSAIKSVYGTVIANCKRDLLDRVISQIGDESLASLHEGGADSRQTLAEASGNN